MESCLSVYARTGNVMEYYPILRQPRKQRKNLCLGGNICVFVSEQRGVDHSFPPTQAALTGRSKLFNFLLQLFDIPAYIYS